MSEVDAQIADVSPPVLTAPAVESVLDLQTVPSGIVLDEHQQRVVDTVRQAGHGPVLLLAGPGTGKTTTLVEAVAARVAAGTDPDRILTLTFSRKAANELRSRIGTRLNRTVAAPLAWTFHGFGYSLVSRTQAADDSTRILRLMSGPEQDVAVRELLANDLAVSSVTWPKELHAALPTRGFTDEIRALLGRARALGLQPADLRRVAFGRADWLAAADFLAEYLDVLDARGVLDYSELIARAVAYVESDHGRHELQSAYDLVVVDEYQDTDPAQERLLQAIAGSGRDLLVVGDPDQAIYRFRGAEVQAIMSFPERFTTSRGEPATTLTLRISRRCPTSVLTASRRVAKHLGGAGTPLVRHLRSHRDLLPGPTQRAGQVEVRTYTSVEAEAAAIADLLRREHLQRGTPWSQMAVLVRAGVVDIPRLQRALIHSEVPVEVAGDEVPLSNEPALAPLMLALHAASDPESLTDDVVRELLLSPLIDCDATSLRRLGRALREQARANDIGTGGPSPSHVLIGEAVRDPSLVAQIDNRTAGPVRRLAALITRAHELVESGASAHEVLWSIWSGTAWPERLRRRSLEAGPAGRAADRALDAVVALFDVASRTDERTTARDVASFAAEVESQQIPGDTLTERSTQPSGVRLLTAHRSKGLEWQVVVVAGVQDELWPDLRRRPSFLQAERLGPDGVLDEASLAEVRRDERRLFYVAVTRAQRRLVVTAVDAPADDGPRPSPFLLELGAPVLPGDEQSLRPLTFAGLTTRLRAAVIDLTQPLAVREAAAERLAKLAELTLRGRVVAPAADPDRWWGLNDTTQAEAPVRSEDEPIELSGSQLEKLDGCRLQWFLSHEVSADPARGTAAGFGSVVHTLADGVARGVVGDTVGELSTYLDSVWGQLPFGAVWESSAERREAEASLERFVKWHQAARERTVIATEQNFECELTVAGRLVRLRGRLDRVELTADGAVVVVDLKTSRKPPTQKSVDHHLQLATYQRVVAESPLPDMSGPPGGAELVQLRVNASIGESGPKVQQQAPSAGSQVLDEALDRAVHTIADEDFHPTVGESCTYCPFHHVCPAQDTGRQVVS